MPTDHQASAALHRSNSPYNEAWRERWAAEWRDGARCAFLSRFEGARESGGYPRGFHAWPLARRNAWFSGFNCGFQDRRRLSGGEG